VVAQPDEQSLVLLHVIWPARPQYSATLLVALDQGDRQSLRLLAQWCTGQASVSPVRQHGAELEFRRRQSLDTSSRAVSGCMRRLRSCRLAVAGQEQLVQPGVLGGEIHRVKAGDRPQHRADRAGCPQLDVLAVM
jgi:hypothetical protein